MKNKYALLLIISLLFGACRSKFKPLLTSESGVQFKMISLNEAKATAKAAGKPLFVFAHASWCPTCKKMEHEILVEKQIGDVYNAQLINVAIDVDSEEGKKLNGLYPIRATPTLLYFNSDGTLAKKWEGFANTNKLLRLLP
ncbi:thioredoxin family protein [Mucilaginibacter terrae]|uniref:thioredoxin family protein n=1 Tax=Mucilaginibacter terrae TaxID=1955052 RepID=UPI003642F117